MKRIILAALVGVLAYSANAGQKPQAWIVLNFRLANGQPVVTSLINPSAPDLTIYECEDALPDATHHLIDVARAQRAILRGAIFESARCVMSARDPLLSIR